VISRVTHRAPIGGAEDSLPEDLRKLGKQRFMNVKRGHPELGRESCTVIHPGLQRCGPVDVGVFDEYLAEVAAPPPADLARFYLSHRNPRAFATEGPTFACIKITLHHSSVSVAIPNTPSSSRPAPRSLTSRSVLSGERGPRVAISQSEHLDKGRDRMSIELTTVSASILTKTQKMVDRSTCQKAGAPQGFDIEPARISNQDACGTIIGAGLRVSASVRFVPRLSPKQTGG
jgi:hypothetical protein